MTQAERLERQATLRAQIAEHEAAVAALRAEEAVLLAECEHRYADGRNASAGGRIRICAVCGQVLAAHDEKLWG